MKFPNETFDFDGNLKIKTKEVLGEGNYSVVYSTTTPKRALKIINASSRKGAHFAKREVEVYKALQFHNNILKFDTDREIIIKKIPYHLILFEACPPGNLADLIKKNKNKSLSEELILTITIDILGALIHLHRAEPSVAHRDVRAENILRGEDGKYKLIDFGHSTRTAITEINSQNRYNIEEEIEEHTSPLVRAPEQADSYSGHPITTSVDIWGLGILLYNLCYQRQPFETKLALINQNFIIPKDPPYTAKLVDLIKMIFEPRPDKRPTAQHLLRYLIGPKPTDGIINPSNTANIMVAPSSENNLFQERGFLDRYEAYSQNDAQNRATFLLRNQVEGNLPPENQSGAKGNMKSSGNIGRTSNNGNGGGETITPNFVDNVVKLGQRLTTKTSGWLLSATEENEEAPKPKYVRYLVIKAWQKRQKIRKFFSLMYKRVTERKDNTIVIMKVLIVLHNYLKKGPSDVFLKYERKDEEAWEILSLIRSSWEQIYLEKVPNPKDRKRCDYLSSIIVEYSKLLQQKLTLCATYSCYFEGNYSLNPYFTNSPNEALPLTKLISDLLAFLGSCTVFQQMFLTNVALWKIQISIVLSIIDEEYCLISLLTHLIRAWKQASNHLTIPVDQKKVQQTFQTVEKRFEDYYMTVKNYLVKLSTMTDFQEQKDLIPSLTDDVLKFLREIPILQKTGNKEFVTSQYLNYQTNIFNLRIPFSYGSAVKDIHLEDIIEIEQKLQEGGNGASNQKKIGQQTATPGDKYCSLDEEKITGNQKANDPNKIFMDVATTKEKPHTTHDDFSVNFAAHTNNEIKQDAVKVNQSSIFEGFNFGNQAGQTKIDAPKADDKPNPPNLFNFPPVVPQSQATAVKHEFPDFASLKKKNSGGKLIDLMRAEAINNKIDFSHQSLNAVMFSDATDNGTKPQQQPPNAFGQAPNPFQSNVLQPQLPASSIPVHPITTLAQQQQQQVPFYQFQAQQPPQQQQNPLQMSYPLAQNNNNNAGANAFGFEKKTNPQTPDFMEVYAQSSQIQQHQQQQQFTKFDNIFGPMNMQIAQIQMNTHNQFNPFLAIGNMGQQGQVLTQSHHVMAPQPQQTQMNFGFGHAPMMVAQTQPAPLQQNNLAIQPIQQQQPPQVLHQQQPQIINNTAAEMKPNNWISFNNGFNDTKSQAPPQNPPQTQKQIADLFGGFEQLTKPPVPAERVITEQPESENSNNVDPAKETSNLKSFIYQQIFINLGDWIISYDQLTFDKQIGSGSSCEVYKGAWRGLDVAIKKMKVASLQENHMKEFYREISALVKLRMHQNLVSLIGVSQNENELCIITEYCSGGTLFDLLHRRKGTEIPWSVKVKFAKDIAQGMLYLHTCNPPIIHRDLKSLNLLLDVPYRKPSDPVKLKIADFGLARTQDFSSMGSQAMMTGLMGTYHWMAPEIFDGKAYSISADVYSFAIVLWEIICRETPYRNLKTPHAIMKLVSIEQGRPDIQSIPSGCPEDLVDLMFKCWDHDPKGRPTFDQILEILRRIETKD